MKENLPKLVLCDVDGTLIDRTEDITPAFKKLKKIIAEYKIPFSIASGRSMDTLKKFADELEITEPIIINNGAGARQNGESLWDDLFPAILVKEAIKKADTMDMAIFMGYGDYELVYRHNAYVQYDIEHFGRYNHFHIPLESEWKKLQFERVMLTDPQKPGRVEELLPYLKKYDDQLEIIQYDSRHIDIMKNGVSKAKGIARLSRLSGINTEDIMVIGDSVNDIEMVEAAGTGVAVGNAKPELKEIADYVCQQNNTLGVIEALTHYYQEDEEV